MISLICFPNLEAKNLKNILFSGVVLAQCWEEIINSSDNNNMRYTQFL